MGREIRGIREADGAAVGLHLESAHLDVRGAVRARLPRTAVAVRADGELLVIESPELPDALRVRLPTGQAERWVAAILKPAPTLADKLGTARVASVYVEGEPPAEVAAALSGLRREPLDAADVAVVTVASGVDLDAVPALLGDVDVPVWIVHGKSGSPAPSGDEVRAVLRAAGLRDLKVTAISEAWSATQYRRSDPRA
jgi:hypothetical protein